MDFVEYIAAGMGDSAEKYGVYPKSVNRVGETTLFMAEKDDKTVLVAVGGAQHGFEGEKGASGGMEYLLCPLSHRNADLLRGLFPFTAPVPVLGAKCTIGVGDRLGIATPGHLRVFEEYDALPVLAQQSIRELDLTGRTYEDVLDSVSFAVYREGFTHGFAADGDHLKKIEDVKYALRLGFTMITLDCSEHIRGDAASMSDAEIADAVTLDAAVKERYLNKTFDLGNGVRFTYGEAELKRITLIYGAAIGFAVRIYEDFIAKAESKVDFEVSIDETATPTTPLEHYFVANELTLRGVRFATIAPRFCGEFQKGVDYIGDIARFEREMAVHSEIARHFGYKISVHSGSDKFAVFPIVGEKTDGRFHLKTAGTSWLEAMRVAAATDPALYRGIHAFALNNFSEATKYYHVTTDLAKIPPLDTLADSQLPSLFDQNDARQLIHITYGLILGAKNADGTFMFRDALYGLWRKHARMYSDALYTHIGRHLRLLGVPKR